MAELYPRLLDAVELREDMNKRFEQMMSMFYILSGIFTAMFTAVFGFAWWDRRSILVQAREMKKVLEPLKAQLQNLQSSEKSALEFLQNPTGCSGRHHSRRASQTHARLLEARRLRPDSPVGMPGGGKKEKTSGMKDESITKKTWREYGF